MSGLFLGGELAPCGTSISFLRLAFDEAASTIAAMRQEWGHTVTIEPIRVEDVISAMEPFQAPWTREVIFDCGAWTAYLNNALDGGDSSAIAPALALRLKTDLLVATHSPRRSVGHAATQLWVIGEEVRQAW